MTDTLAAVVAAHDEMNIWMRVSPRWDVVVSWSLCWSAETMARWRLPVDMLTDLSLLLCKGQRIRIETPFLANGGSFVRCADQGTERTLQDGG